MRDSTIIYRSFYEAVKELPAINQAEVWTAIFEYSLNFRQIELIGLSKTIFTLIKPQLDANIKRYENGKRPKSAKKEAEPKQKVSESEANVNDNVNVNGNVNGNSKLFDTPVLNKPVKRKKEFIPPTVAECTEYFLSCGYSKELADRFFQSYAVAEWSDSKGNKILNWKQKAINVWFKEENKVKPTEPTQVYNKPEKYRPTL